jgi:hypothetical protein
VIVTVTTLGTGVGVVKGPVACSAEVPEQVDLARAVVVASSRGVVVQLDLGATVVALTASVEQVDWRASSLQTSQQRQFRDNEHQGLGSREILTEEGPLRPRPTRPRLRAPQETLLDASWCFAALTGRLARLCQSCRMWSTRGNEGRTTPKLADGRVSE